MEKSRNCTMANIRIRMPFAKNEIYICQYYVRDIVAKLLLYHGGEASVCSFGSTGYHHRK